MPAFANGEVRLQSNHQHGARLVKRFTAAFGKDFELVRSVFKTRSNGQGGGTFWLAYAKPLRAGQFYLQYRYKDSDPDYSHVEHEIRFSVGPPVCRRGPLGERAYTRFCLGDTIIIPVLVNRFTQHEFKLVKAEYAGDKEEPTLDDQWPEVGDQKLNKAEVANPAAESLRYVGRNSHKMFHRGQGYTIQHYAVFEAVNPGRLNLLVSPSTHAAISLNEPRPTPIIVVARGTPVTLIAGREEVRWFIVGRDGRERRFAASPESHTSSLMILQPGDRISVIYFSAFGGMRRERKGSGGLEAPEPPDDVKPAISVYPFLMETKYDFSDWLKGYLPQG